MIASGPQVGVPQVAKGKVEQPDNQDQARQRQPQTEPETGGHRAERPQFQHRFIGQSGGLPLDDSTLQTRHRDQAERLQQSRKTVWGRQADQNCGSDKQAPTARV